MPGILILGAGGHGKVVADILQLQGYNVRGYLDDLPETWGTSRLGLTVLAALDRYQDFEPDGVIIGIGSNEFRKKIVERLGAAAQLPWINAIHPQAILASSAQLGKGIVLAAGAIVNPDVIIRNHVIINTAASVDHDCHIGDYVHIAPGTHLGGTVKVDEGALVGIGSTVIPNVTVGCWTTVKAGAVVINNIPEWVTAKGVPARWEQK